MILDSLLKKEHFYPLHFFQRYRERRDYNLIDNHPENALSLLGNIFSAPFKSSLIMER
jgi:hypothetical protein